jgi:hypothetical protein
LTKAYILFGRSFLPNVWIMFALPRRASILHAPLRRKAAPRRPIARGRKAFSLISNDISVSAAPFATLGIANRGRDSTHTVRLARPRNARPHSGAVYAGRSLHQRATSNGMSRPTYYQAKANFDVILVGNLRHRSGTRTDLRTTGCCLHDQPSYSLYQFRI